MFAAPEFWSPEVYRVKVKTPEEFVVSAVRASGAEVTNALPLLQSLEKLGMPLYGMQTPNGYSWMAEPWVSTGALVGRMNFALALSSNRLPEVRTDWTAMLAKQERPAVRSVDDDPDALAVAKVKQLEMLLLEQAVSEKTRATVLQQLRDTTVQQQAEKSFSIRPTDPEPMAPVLNAGMPEVRAGAPLDREAAVMAGLLLGSPEFQRR
jgi:hypothetical protein